MILLFALLSLLFANGLRFKASARPALGAAVLLLGYYAGWLWLLQTNLSAYSPDGTYGSDARYYWHCMQSVAHGFTRASNHDGRVYVWWGAQILQTAPEAVIWVKIGNLLLTCNAFLFVFGLIARRFPDATPRTMRLLLWTTWIAFANGVVVWMVIRNIKENLLLALLTGYIAAVVSITDSARLSRTAKTVLITLLTVSAVWPLENIRPFGGAFASIFLAAHLLRLCLLQSRSRKRRFVGKTILAAAGLGIGLLTLKPDLFEALAGAERVKTLEAFGALQQTTSGTAVESATQAFGRTGAFPFYVVRFVTGPGPIRAAQQLATGDMFVVSARVGDAAVLEGCLQWWLTLAVCGMVWFQRPRALRDTLRRTYDMAAPSLAVIVAYSFIYQGTGDTRHRAFLYCLLACVLVPAQVLALQRRIVTAPQRELAFSV